MKKNMIGLSLALIIGLFSTFSYADGSLDGVNLYGDPTNNYSQPLGEYYMDEQDKTLKEYDNYKFNKNNDNSRNHCRK